MTPDDFKAWRATMGYNQVQAAEALGLSKSSIELYEKGKRRDDGRAVEIPITVSLSCAALFHRLEPWEQSAAGKAAVKRAKEESDAALAEAFKKVMKKPTTG